MRLLRAYIESRAVFVIAVLVAVMDALFIARIFWPEALALLVNTHAFEAIVLFVLTQMLLVLWVISSHNPNRVLRSEDECSAELIKFLRENKRSKYVAIFSCGVASRENLLASVMNDADLSRISVEVLAQDPEEALDQYDARRIRDTVPHLLESYPSERIAIRYFRGPASVRAVVACDKERRPLWGAVGWYVYSPTGDPGRGVAVKGRGLPTVVCSDARSDDHEVLEFAMTEFRHRWADSREVAA